jgi:hypothetical protein
MITSGQSDLVPAGTRVLNTNDGEPGTILNGFSFDPVTGQCFEVQTHYGIERWNRSDFVLMSEISEVL